MYTKPLTELRATDADIAGGKGAMLGELTHMVSELTSYSLIEVPEGYVVLAKAWEDRFKKSYCELMDKIDNELCLNWRIEWAVRSSAIGEDGATASFAGQNDSFLNVDSDEVAEKIWKVWDSLNSEHATEYRKMHNLPSMPMAVVVQKMVHPEIAGVAFSADPCTGDLKSGIIEYVTGLGDKLVSGEVTPTTFFFNHNRERLVALDFPEEWKLEEAIAMEPIANVVIEIQEKLGYPVDMEWAWKDGTLYILQVRPITTL